jgi:TolB protein
MRKIAVALVLVVAACGGEATPSTTVPASSTSTVSPSTTTTTSVDTVPTTSTTTTTTAPVSTPPAALGRDEIPWAEVGPGWYVALYDASLYDPEVGWVADGPSLLYLVSGAGDLYEITEWSMGEMKPWQVLDVRDGAALVVSDAIELVDLASGNRAVVWDPPPEEREFLVEWEAWLAATGDAVSIVRSDGAAEWVERRSLQSGPVVRLFEQSAEPYPAGLFGLDLPGESETVIAHRSGITLVDSAGDVVAELWAPAESICQPIRWWQEGVFLAVCDGQTAESAPVNEYGPHTYYGRLWLLRTDGSEGVALTSFPGEAPIVSDFGYRNALRAGPETLVQWRGDCGAAGVARLGANGPIDFVQVESPASWTPMGVELIGTTDDSITVRAWDSCGGGFNTLFTVALDGSLLVDLIPAGAGHVGVIDAWAL